MTLGKTTRWACPNCSGDYLEHPVFLTYYRNTHDYECPSCHCVTSSPSEDLCVLLDEEEQSVADAA